MNKLAIVVPTYNEEEVLEKSAQKLLSKLDTLVIRGAISKESYIAFVDDGSHDSTWEIINDLATKDRRFKGVKLSRNYGQQNAILAGLFALDADAYITIDVDLQDDIDVIDQMIEKGNEGFEIVYGVRENRDEDSYFKRSSANLFYKYIMRLGIDIVPNHSEFRYMSARTVEALKSYDEINLFLRGIVPLIGYKSINVYYARQSRVAGESKYSVHRLISLAWQAITSFSVLPLRVITFLGFSFFIFSIFLGFWVLYSKFVAHTAVPGWASTMLFTNFMGGIQLLSIGIIGEYIGKIYQEVKRRPRYFIDAMI